MVNKPLLWGVLAITPPPQAGRHCTRAVLQGLSVLSFLLLCLGQSVWASNFEVNPVLIVLSAQTRSAVLHIRNTSDTALRFQANVFTWDQSLAGEMVLTSTEDLVLFPSLLTLAPGEVRNVRLGTTTPPSTIEKAYRVFVEELQPLDDQPAATNQIRVLMKFGIPVFLTPTTAVQRGGIQELSVQGGHASFVVQNTGTLHFTVQHIQLQGLGAAGEVIVTQPLTGWYILAGGSRRYDVALSTQDCRKSTAVVVEVRTEHDTFKAQTPIALEHCGP
jgi:fimbrial chaperone protein